MKFLDCRHPLAHSVECKAKNAKWLENIIVVEAW